MYTRLCDTTYYVLYYFICFISDDNTDDDGKLRKIFRTDKQKMFFSLA